MSALLMALIIGIIVWDRPQVYSADPYCAWREQTAYEEMRKFSERAERLSAQSLNDFAPQIILLTREDIGFKPIDIALCLELQKYTWDLCVRYARRAGLSTDELYELVLKVMWKESRHRVDIPDNLNTNGSRDRGPMQINSVNWGWLSSDYGLDVNDYRQNIEAGVLMLSRLLERHSVEHALTAYWVGEGGARRIGGSSSYSRSIMSMSFDTFYH